MSKIKVKVKELKRQPFNEFLDEHKLSITVQEVTNGHYSATIEGLQIYNSMGHSYCGNAMGYGNSAINATMDLATYLSNQVIQAINFVGVNPFHVPILTTTNLELEAI